jgi:CheY-like chemotaxis protein
MAPNLELSRWKETPRETRRRPLVLVAEPDHLRAALVVAGLDDRGIDGLWTADGEATLELAEEQTFDVLVADPSLRGAGGEQVVQTLLVEHPSVPLVVTASSGALLHLVSARIPAADVVDLVCAALGRHRSRATGT